MGTIKKAQFGERVGRQGRRECGLERQIRKEERQAARENRQADRQARREERRAPKMRYGGKAKKGGSFPDLTGDGKVTRADILKGRGVIKNGGKLKKQAAIAIAMKKAGKKPKKAMNGTTASAQRKARAAASIGRQASAMRKARTAARPMMKMGGKCRGGCY